METYKIIRFFQSGERKTMETGLTLEEAQEHCNDPETSSKTCTRPELLLVTQKRGPWFDGYEEE
jgi:hypothetical protein